MKAVWKDEIIAESNDTVVVEGNHYFPRSELKDGCFTDSSTTSNCPWKGTASYFSITVNGETNVDAAWYYADPKPAASEIKGRVAFWKGIQVVD